MVVVVPPVASVDIIAQAKLRVKLEQSYEWLLRAAVLQGNGELFRCTADDMDAEVVLDTAMGARVCAKALANITRRIQSMRCTSPIGMEWIIQETLMIRGLQDIDSPLAHLSAKVMMQAFEGIQKSYGDVNFDNRQGTYFWMGISVLQAHYDTSVTGTAEARPHAAARPLGYAPHAQVPWGGASAAPCRATRATV
jgi:hypothetical protein